MNLNHYIKKNIISNNFPNFYIFNFYSYHIIYSKNIFIFFRIIFKAIAHDLKRHVYMGIILISSFAFYPFLSHESYEFVSGSSELN